MLPSDGLRLTGFWANRENWRSPPPMGAGDKAMPEATNKGLRAGRELGIQDEKGFITEPVG